MLRVNEIFFSIQGESSFAGLPCVFVRLTRCDLRCTYCDTEYAFHEGVDMELGEIIHRVQAYGTGLVELTGGEPLLQKESLELVTTLLDGGKQVLIETSGSVAIDPVDPRAVVIMDLKCPGSGMAERNRWENIEHLRPKDEVKFVIGDRVDYEWSRQVLERYRLNERCSVLFSPVFEKLQLRELAEWILADKLPVRLQTQLHKWIWDPATRGV